MHSISRKAALILRSSPGKSEASCVPVWERLDRNHSHDPCNLCLMSLMFLFRAGPRCSSTAVQMCSLVVSQPRWIAHRRALGQGTRTCGPADTQEHRICCLCWVLGEHGSICPELSWISGAGWTCKRGICHQVRVFMLLVSFNHDQGIVGELFL